jgi:hypothetical protein
MANLTPYLTEKYTKMIAEITADLGKTADDLANLQNIIRGVHAYRHRRGTLVVQGILGQGTGS